jgi:hypothetical protein
MLTREGLISLTFGLVSGEAQQIMYQIDHYPLWCWLFILGGSGLILKDLLTRDSIIENAIKTCGIGNKENRPRIVKEDQHGYKVHMPNGTTSEDFKNKSLAISQAIGKDVNVEFKHVGKSTLHMKVIKDELKDQYEFEPIKFKHPTEIPIGHSNNGFISLHLSDKYPNLLIAGCTGSGKSTCLNQIIINTILTQSKDKVLLNLIDLKSGIEFIHFKKCSMVNSYATDIEPAEQIILSLEKIAKYREQLFVRSGVSKIDDYNKRYKNKQLPYHLVIVDEFADLREQKHIVSTFDRVLRKGRSSGIFFILSTQRPTVDSIPGNLKANIQCYLAFRTTSPKESEIILGYGNQEAYKINVTGRGIFQAYEKTTVQPMYIKNEDKIIVPLIKHTYRMDVVGNNIGGVVKC